MARFFAQTSRGLMEVLGAEIENFGFKNVERGAGGYHFDSNWAGCYRLNLRSRVATRVLLPILDFPAYKNEDLYNNILRHDFTKYIPPNGTLAVEASVRDSAFKDQRFVAMKVKDAVVDQFRDKFGERPNVDSESPDLRIIVRAVESQFHVAIDTTGEPLFKRGYRVGQVAAHLKEHVAAGLLQLTTWDRVAPMVDPMCGSGTFLIEAALMSLNVAPGTMRRHFGFQRLNNFQVEQWDREVAEAMSEEKEIQDEEPTDGVPVVKKFFGFDVDKDALQVARKNANAAGVGHLIEFARHPMETLKAPAAKGIMITNPPYGDRLGEKEELVETYKNLAHTMKTAFKGWDCYVLSGDPGLSAAMHLKAERKFPVYNGPIECRFLKYKMF